MLGVLEPEQTDKINNGVVARGKSAWTKVGSAHDSLHVAVQDMIIHTNLTCCSMNAREPDMTYELILTVVRAQSYNSTSVVSMHA